MMATILRAAVLMIGLTGCARMCAIRSCPEGQAPRLIGYSCQCLPAVVVLGK